MREVVKVVGPKKATWMNREGEITTWYLDKSREGLRIYAIKWLDGSGEATMGMIRGDGTGRGAKFTQYEKLEGIPAEHVEKYLPEWLAKAPAKKAAGRKMGRLQAQVKLELDELKKLGQPVPQYAYKLLAKTSDNDIEMSGMDVSEYVDHLISMANASGSGVKGLDEEIADIKRRAGLK